MGVRHYRELELHRRAFVLQQQLFEISKGCPKSEVYALTDQIRRSSRSVGSNIAETWRKRRYQAHFVSKLTDSDAELAETRHWIVTAKACGYLDADLCAEHDDAAAQPGRMVGSMIRDADRWCQTATTARRRTAP